MASDLYFSPENIEVIANGFIEAAIFAEAPECTSGIDWEIANRASVVKYCRAFVDAYPLTSKEVWDRYPGDLDESLGRFGNDLFFTAAGHGVGFWDREFLGPLGKEISELIKRDWRLWHVETNFDEQAGNVRFFLNEAYR
jgi:hypothetical protein